MKEITRIELSEKDIKDLVAEKFNLDPSTTICRVSVYDGDRPGMGSSTSIVVEGQKLPSVPYSDR